MRASGSNTAIRGSPEHCDTGVVNDHTIRKARRDDVEAIVHMLADDQLGAARDDPADLVPYLHAFDDIDADPNQLLVVVVSDDQPIGTLQLTMIPGLARRGALRGQIEAVRIRADHRGSGLGADLLQWAIDESRRRGCALVQLTSDTSRTQAHRFYERLGFEPTHTGFKLKL
jgi:GNAT superfamily N-acetyltransferase